MASLADSPESETRDSLTGLADLSSARATIARWQRDWPVGQGECPLHAMLISLARIETVNVAYGETTGDGALVETAQRIKHFASDELESGVWLAARAAGGSFLLLAREDCSRERWQWLGEALADAVAMPISGQGMGATLHLWPRIALLRSIPGDTPDTVLDRLAEASARIRELQGQRVIWASGEAAPDGRSNRQLEGDLLAAIDRDEIEVLFQPQYCAASGHLVGAEALARWEHPVLGRLGAATLFMIAERTDHVAQLSRHIVRRALDAASKWPGNIGLSVNITPADLAVGSFAKDFVAMMDSSGLSAARVTIEITEQVLLAELDRASEVLADLKAHGVSLALDDFGAGFCNFAYLKILPLDAIKLDRSMVEGILEDSRDLAVFRAILAMAKALDLSVVAEGIETEGQREVVVREGCDVWQGFLGSEPLSEDEFSVRAAA